jgi:hypothetical protein
MKRILVFLLTALATAPMQARAAETLDQVLEKNTAAMGGREALDAMKGFAYTSTLKVTPSAANKPPYEGSSKSNYKSPDKAHVATTFHGVTRINATNGKQYWEWDSSKPLAGANIIATAIAASRIDDAKISNTYLANYPNLGVKLELVGTEKVGDREAFVITTTRPYGNQTRVFLDKETGLMIKEESATSARWLSDWRKVDGVMFAHKVRMVYPDRVAEMTLDNVKVNPEIADDIFNPPPPVPKSQTP